MTELMTDIDDILKNKNKDGLKQYIKIYFPEKYFPNKKLSDYNRIQIKNYLISFLIYTIESENVIKYDNLKEIIDILQILFDYNPLFEDDTGRDMEDIRRDLYATHSFFGIILNDFDTASYKIIKKIYEITSIFTQNNSFMKYINQNRKNDVPDVPLIISIHLVKTLFEYAKKNRSLEKYNEVLEKENEMMKEQIYYAPDGDGAKAAKEHFIQTMAAMEKN